VIFFVPGETLEIAIDRKDFEGTVTVTYPPGYRRRKTGMRNAHHQFAAVPKDAPHFRDRPAVVLNVHQTHGCNDDVKLSSFEIVKRIRIRMNEADGGAVGLRPFTRHLNELCAAIHASDDCTASRQFARISTFAAPKVQHRLSGDLSEQRQEARHQVQIAVVIGVGMCDPVSGDAIPRTRRRVLGHERSVGNGGSSILVRLTSRVLTERLCRRMSSQSNMNRMRYWSPQTQT
jgi:hypothetical protein